MANAPGTTVPIKLVASGEASVAAAFGKVQASAHGLKVAVESIDGVFRRLGPSLAAAFSGATLIGALREAVNSADNFAKLSQRVGATTESLSALAYAGKLSDVGINELSISLQKYGQYLSKTGQGTKDLTEALIREADVFAKMPDGPTKTARAIELFGKSGVQMIPMLNGGAEGLRDMTDEARALGLVISSETARQAEEFNDNLTRLQSSATGLATTLARDLVPGLNDVLKTFLAANRASAGASEGGGGILQSLLSIGSSVTRWEVERAMTITSAASSFFKSLISGDGIRGSAEAAKAAASETLAKFRGELEKLNKATKEGAKEQEGFAAALDDTFRRLELDLAAGKNSLASILGDPSLSRTQKHRESMELYAKQLEIVGKLQEELEANLPANAVLFTDEDGNLRATEEWLKGQREALALSRQRIDLMNQRDRLGPDPESVSQNIRFTTQEIVDSFGTVAEQIADGFRNVIGTAVGSITDGITGLIMRTKTWGQALAEIGTSILTGIVRALVGIGVQWVATQILMATVGKAIMGASVAAAVPFAAASSAIWAAPATLATIATYGSAAAAAPGFITSASAITTASAVSQSLVGFESGGWTGSGRRSDIAGLVHREEFVVNAPTVARVGLPALEAMQSGDAAPTSSGGQSPPGRPINQAFFDSRQDAQRWADSQGGETWFVDMARRTSHRWGRS